MRGSDAFDTISVSLADLLPGDFVVVEWREDGQSGGRAAHHHHRAGVRARSAP
jgi:hypothetical protein